MVLPYRMVLHSDFRSRSNSLGFAVIFCATVFVAVDRHSHSVSDTLYGIFPFFVCTFLLFDWVGSRTCGTDRPAVN